MTHIRTFCIAQGSLTVMVGQEAPQRFADSDEGLAAFDAYLAANADVPSQIMLDVIEEVFAVDSVPKIGARDRKALIERRRARKFPRSPYRASMAAGSDDAPDGEIGIVHSSISNHELVDPWLSVIRRHAVPLRGIYSVPLVAPRLLSRLFSVKGPVLLLTQHQGDKLRQVFLRDGRVMSGRLSQCPPPSAAEHAEATATEIMRGRRYLERIRLIGGMEQLNVCLVAESERAERIIASAPTDSPLKFHVMETAGAAARVGLKTPPDEDHLEALYVAAAEQRRPQHAYTRSVDARYWRMRRLRQAIIGTSFAASVSCSILAGLFLADAWLVTGRALEFESQVEQLSQALRRDNDRYMPIQADSHEMQVAVDTGDYILANRVPAPWVMQQVGRVMGEFPDVQVTGLDWKTAAAQAPAGRGRNSQPMPVSLPPIAAVDAHIDGMVARHDGDLRHIFERIDALAAALRDRTEFTDVDVLRYPLDASPGASISGEISSQSGGPGTGFRLALRLAIATDDASDDFSDGSTGDDREAG